MAKVVEFWTARGPAQIIVTGIAKEFRKSIRFALIGGSTMTIRKADIISIEEE